MLIEMNGQTVLSLHDGAKTRVRIESKYSEEF